MFGFNMNTMSQEDQMVTKEIHKICDEHPACKDCPMKSGESIEIMGKQCCCITAIMKIQK